MSSTADPAPQGRPRKTDYFATFLNTRGNGATGAPPAPIGVGPQHATALANFATAAATHEADPLGGILRSLSWDLRCWSARLGAGSDR